MRYVHPMKPVKLNGTRFKLKEDEKRPIQLSDSRQMEDWEKIDADEFFWSHFQDVRVTRIRALNSEMFLADLWVGREKREIVLVD